MCRVCNSSSDPSQKIGGPGLSLRVLPASPPNVETGAGLPFFQPVWSSSVFHTVGVLLGTLRDLDCNTITHESSEPLLVYSQICRWLVTSLFFGPTHVCFGLWSSPSAAAWALVLLCPSPPSNRSLLQALVQVRGARSQGSLGVGVLVGGRSMAGYRHVVGSPQVPPMKPCDKLRTW